MIDGTFNSIDEYIASCPADVQVILREVRRTIAAAAPGTEGAISYGIPTFKLHGRYVIYFAGWKHHLSIYPIPAVDAALDKALEPYKAAKGTLRFPLDKPIPYDLIEQVTVAALRGRQGKA